MDPNKPVVENAVLASTAKGLEFSPGTLIEFGPDGGRVWITEDGGVGLFGARIVPTK